MVKIELDNVLKDLIEQNKEKLKENINNIKEGNEAISDIIDPDAYFEIYKDDSLLTQIVKEIINENKVNVRSLPFEKMNDMNNYIRSLKIHRTMSINKFEVWMDLLNVKWKILYGDEADKFDAYQKEELKKKLNKNEKDGVQDES